MERARIDFAQKSLEKSKEYKDDPLIKFVILWIGLNALYAKYNREYASCTDPNCRSKKNDGHDGPEVPKIKNCFQQNEGKIREIIHTKKQMLQKMQKVIQANPRQHSKIKRYLENYTNIFDDRNSECVLCLGQLLNKVRNNMFHAAKQWDEKAEQELISTINPILEDILSAFITQ